MKEKIDLSFLIIWCKECFPHWLAFRNQWTYKLLVQQVQMFSSLRKQHNFLMDSCCPINQWLQLTSPSRFVFTLNTQPGSCATETTQPVAWHLSPYNKKPTRTFHFLWETLKNTWHSPKFGCETASHSTPPYILILAPISWSFSPAGQQCESTDSWVVRSFSSWGWNEPQWPFQSFDFLR